MIAKLYDFFATGAVLIALRCRGDESYPFVCVCDACGAIAKIPGGRPIVAATEDEVRASVRSHEWRSLTLRGGCVVDVCGDCTGAAMWRATAIAAQRELAEHASIGGAP